MRSKTKTALLVSAVLWIVAMMVWPGCATPPLPSSRKPIQARKMEDFNNFPKSWPPSRSDIVHRLGEPDAYLPDSRIACYRVNEVTRRKLWLCLFVIPINVEKRSGYVEIAFIEFDERDHVRRSGTRIGRRQETMSYAAQRWLAAQEPKKREH